MSMVSQYQRCLQAVEGDTEVHKAKHVPVKSDKKILEPALQDLGMIKAVKNGTIPVEALRTAKHLNEAYKDYLQKMRVVEDMPRLWEDAPETEVCGCHTAACDVNSSSYTSCISCRMTF